MDWQKCFLDKYTARKSHTKLGVGPDWYISPYVFCILHFFLHFFCVNSQFVYKIRALEFLHSSGYVFFRSYFFIIISKIHQQIALHNANFKADLKQGTGITGNLRVRS